MKKIISRIREWIISFLEKWRKDTPKAMPLKSPTWTQGGVTVIDTGKDVHEVDLVDDSLSKTEKKKLRQYTKILVTTLTIAGIVWITWSYVLATIALMKYQNFSSLESISTKVCETILGIVIVYGFKSFLETFSEKKNEIKLKELDKEVPDIEVPTLQDPTEPTGGELNG